MEGRAYLLRPDTPKEGLLRQQRSGETEDELSEPIRSQVREANLIMRPPQVTPNTMYALEATEYAQQHGKFMEFHHAAIRPIGKTTRTWVSLQCCPTWPGRWGWTPTS